MFIGIGEGRTRGRPLQPQVLQFPLARRQSAHDLPQRPRTAQMTEQQRDELAPARHPFGMLLGLALTHSAFKYRSRDEVQNLTEYAAYSTHGRVILSCWSLALPTLHGSLALSFPLTALGRPSSLRIYFGQQCNGTDSCRTTNSDPTEGAYASPGKDGNKSVHAIDTLAEQERKSARNRAPAPSATTSYIALSVARKIRVSATGLVRRLAI